MNRFLSKKYIYSLSFVFFALFTSSCALETLWGGYAVTETLTVVNTDKTIADNITSKAVEKDCSSVRKSRGGEYCLENKLYAKPSKKVYCYDTIADPVCYTSKRPYGESRELNTIIK